MDQLQPVAGDLAGVPTLPHYNIKSNTTMCTLNGLKLEFRIQQQCCNHCDLEKHVPYVIKDTLVEGY